MPMDSMMTMTVAVAVHDQVVALTLAVAVGAAAVVLRDGNVLVAAGPAAGECLAGMGRVAAVGEKLACRMRTCL